MKSPRLLHEGDSYLFRSFLSPCPGPLSLLPNDGWPPAYEPYALNAPSYEQHYGLNPYLKEHSR
jgi:hypothetical protein